MIEIAIPSRFREAVGSLSIQPLIERLSVLPKTISIGVPENPLIRTGAGAAVFAPIAVGLSYLASGGTPLPELMLEASKNSKPFLQMSIPEMYQQAVAAVAFLGMPVGAFLGSYFSSNNHRL